MAVTLKSSLEEINRIRINRLHELMNEKGIPSIRQLCSLTGIQPAALSRMLSENKLAEKHARAIEEYFKLPILWLDMEHCHTKIPVPVYFLDSFTGLESSKADFHIDKVSSESDFYIKLNHRIGFISEGHFLKFYPENNIQNIKFDDICIIYLKETQKHIISQFKGNKFVIDNSFYNISDVNIVAKCISIEI